MAAPLEFPVHIAARVRECVPSEIENHVHTMALHGRKIKGWLQHAIKSVQNVKVKYDV